MKTKIQGLLAKDALKHKPSIDTNVAVKRGCSFLDWWADLYEQWKLCYSTCDANNVMDEDRYNKNDLFAEW